MFEFDNKEGLRMTTVIFSRCAVFGLRFPFLLLLDFAFTCVFLNVDYSVYVIKIALFRISLFLSHLDANIKIRNLFLGLNKVFFKKKKKKEKEGTRLGADISLPHCLATGIRNLALKVVTGHKSRGILLGMTL